MSSGYDPDESDWGKFGEEGTMCNEFPLSWRKHGYHSSGVVNMNSGIS